MQKVMRLSDDVFRNLVISDLESIEKSIGAFGLMLHFFNRNSSGAVVKLYPLHDPEADDAMTEGFNFYYMRGGYYISDSDDEGVVRFPNYFPKCKTKEECLALIRERYRQLFFTFEYAHQSEIGQFIEQAMKEIEKKHKCYLASHKITSLLLLNQTMSQRKAS